MHDGYYSTNREFWQFPAYTDDVVYAMAGWRFSIRHLPRITARFPIRPTSALRLAVACGAFILQAKEMDQLVEFGLRAAEAESGALRAAAVRQRGSDAEAH